MTYVPILTIINTLQGKSMKKKDVVNLIRFHNEGDETGFNKQAMQIADDFYDSGDVELSRYIYSLLSDASTIVPQEDTTKHIGALQLFKIESEPLYLPQQIKNNLIGIVNAVKRNIGLNTFLFYGHPGTGKTEASFNIARLLKRRLWKVNISQLIDSHLGETSKNINNLFESINSYPFKKTMLVLFDEIDALALRRDDSRDLREMARATTELFKGLDGLDKDVVLIATTNMYKQLDSALVRRFVSKVSFDCYSREELIDIGLKLYRFYLNKIDGISNDERIVYKILNSIEKMPYPGELKNIIKSSLAFSNIDEPHDYLKRLIVELDPECDLSDALNLKEKFDFSTRDIELITGVSKSEVARRIKNG